ncbi:Os06g0318100 [Oryza sativa Japonica Group]|uniref:Os06g0318100 protein n=3 Tax=Oryza TaxID=4527 RepID=A0A0P0WVW4_ORYSJ|nr:Os06g0318100 [Oryza sativa Japonica Group]
MAARHACSMAQADKLEDSRAIELEDGRVSELRGRCGVQARRNRLTSSRARPGELEVWLVFRLKNGGAPGLWHGRLSELT